MESVILEHPLGDNPPKATLYYGANSLQVLRSLPANSIHMCATSPPYYCLRDYETDPVQWKDWTGELGSEPSPEMYVQHLVEIFREVHRVLRADGTLWLNLGDSYNGSGGAGGDYNKGGIKEGQPRYKGHKIATLKNKDMIGAPWRTALALQADGWWLRSDIIWNKPNTMPESVTDRPSKTHEYVFLLTKSQKYYYDQDAIREPHTEESLSRVERGRGADHKWVDGPGDQTLNSAENLEHACHPLGRNKRTVWTVSPQPYAEAHFATWPEKLVQPMILAGAPRGGTVLDPFSGSGTTGQVALREGRNYIGIDVQPNYLPLAKARILGTPVVSEENPVDEDAYPVLDMFREW